MKLSEWQGPWPALTKCINNDCSCGVEELVNASHEMFWASHANMMIFEPRMCMEVIDWFEPETDTLPIRWNADFDANFITPKPTPGMDDMIDALQYMYPDIKDTAPPDCVPRRYKLGELEKKHLRDKRWPCPECIMNVQCSPECSEQVYPDPYIGTAMTSANAGELVEIKIGEDFDMLEMQKTLYECKCETLLSGHWAGCPHKKD